MRDDWRPAFKELGNDILLEFEYEMRQIYHEIRYFTHLCFKVFTTHNQMEPVLEMISQDSKFDDFKLYPCMPYAHKYADASCFITCLQHVILFITFLWLKP